MEGLLLGIYNGMKWSNYSEVGKKLNIVKKQKKNEEKKAQKQKEKLKKQKKEQADEGIVIKDVKPKEDDLFGGAGMNSKQ